MVFPIKSFSSSIVLIVPLFARSSAEKGMSCVLFTGTLCLFLHLSARHIRRQHANADIHTIPLMRPKRCKFTKTAYSAKILSLSSSHQFCQLLRSSQLFSPHKMTIKFSLSRSNFCIHYAGFHLFREGLPHWCFQPSSLLSAFSSETTSPLALDVFLKLGITPESEC